MIDDNGYRTVVSQLLRLVATDYAFFIGVSEHGAGGQQIPYEQETSENQSFLRDHGVPVFSGWGLQEAGRLWAQVFPEENYFL